MSFKEKKEDFFNTNLKHFQLFPKDKVERLNVLKSFIDERSLVEVSVKLFYYIEYLQILCVLVDKFIGKAIEYAVKETTEIDEVKFLCKTLIDSQKIIEKELFELGAERNDSKINLIPNIESLDIELDVLIKEKFNNFEEVETNITNYIQSNKYDGSLENQFNPYPEVFLDYFSFKLFERLHQTYNEESNQMANYSYIYRKMYGDGFIKSIQKPEVFRIWLEKKPYCIFINSIKQMRLIGRDGKEKIYLNTMLIIRNELE